MVLVGVTWFSPSHPASDAGMAVEIAPVASAPPTPPQQTAPGPQAVKSTVKPQPVEAPKIPPPPRLTVPVKAEVQVPTKSDTQPDRPVMKQAADQTTAPQAVSAPPKSISAAPTSGASTIASNAPQTWENLVVSKLARNKRYPSAAQLAHEEDNVYVQLVIDAAGRLISAKIMRSRGVSALDQEVLSLAHRSSPFPPPPGSQSPPVTVVVPVEFYISARHR